MFETAAHYHRVRLAFRGREPDRVPVLDLAGPEHSLSPTTHGTRTLPGSSIVFLSADLTPRYPIQILEQDGDDLVRTTPYGCVMRLSANGVRPPEIVDHPLKTRADWRLLARRLEATPDRIDWEAIKSISAEARGNGLYLAFASHAGLESCALLAGTRGLVDLVTEDPGLVREVAETQAGLLTGVVDLLRAEGFEVDAAFLFDQLAGVKGPTIPVDRFREVFAPVYRWLADFFHSRDMKVIGYSSGDLRPLIPELLEAGLDCLGPLEVAAGMNLPILKLNYGADMAFLGGIDQRALRAPDPAMLEREIALKVRAGMAHGRYIAGFDGPLPVDVATEQYAHAAELLATYGRY